MSSPHSQPTDTGVHCPECDYNLTGTTEGRCPWCGWVINERVLSTISQDRSNARRIAAIVTCLVCGGGSVIAVTSLVWHSSTLSLRDGLAAIGVLIAAAGHGGLAGVILRRRERWPIYQRGGGTMLRFAGWFSIGLGVVGATELLGSRDVLGVPVAATFEFALAALLYTLPGAALLVMRMVSFRDPDAPAYSEARHAVGDKNLDTHAPFLVDVIGRFGESAVTQSWLNEPQATTPAIEASINQVWTSAVALARVEDAILFDGDLVRLRSTTIRGSSLHVELGPTSYRAFMGTNMNGGIMTNPKHRGFLANPLGISASVITQDGFVAYGRRGRRVAYHAGYVHPFGGMVDQGDRREDGHVDLFGAMQRELEEELGLTREDVADAVVIGLVRDRRLLQPELIFDVMVRCTRRALEARFDPQRSGGEHTAIEFLYDDPDAALPSLTRLGHITPVAEAAYLLHGYTQWGPQWYEQTCLSRYGERPDQTIQHTGEAPPF